MALTKVINDLADLNQSGSTNALKGCAGTTAQQPPSDSTVDYLIVGGGGGGGKGSGAGGGGAGGIVTGTNNPVYHGTPTVITVGEGGIGSTSTTVVPDNGNDSGFNGLRAIGGGAGGCETAGYKDGQLGASGGGGNYTAGAGGAALQGNIGGIGGSGNPDYTGGGGGGASAVGTAGGGSSGGPGSGSAGPGGDGTDYTSFISVVNANLAQIGDTSNGTQVYFAGGGGGGSQSGGSPGTPGAGGLGGGGTGMPYNVVAQLPSVDEDGLRNSGGGAGGGAGGSSLISPNGGSGVVALKYDNTEITGYSLNSGDTATINWPAGAFGRAYWPLNLNTKDIGGNYDGTAADITYVDGKFNQAASFNGSSSAIVLPNNILSSDFSISVWFYLNSTSGNQYLFEFDYECRVIFRISSTDSNWAYIGNSGYFNPGITYNTGQWYHLVITFSNGNPFKIYVDNTLSYTGGNTSTNTTSNDNILGAANSSGSGAINGMIEQLRIYGSALTESNIADIYNNSKPGTLQVAKTASDITTSTCNFPSGVTGTALYQFEANANDSCTVGPYNGISTVNDPSYVNGKFGTYAASFNGSTSILDTTYTLSSTTFSASCWVKFGTQSLGYETIITCTDDSAGSGNDGFTIAVDKCWVNENDAFPYTAEITYSATVNDDVWHNIVVTNDGTTLKVYIDGVLDGSISSTGWTDYGTNPLVFGYQPRSPVNQWYNGLIDQVRMYNTALTAANVYDLWQKENDIQTYFPNTPTSGTDTLVFKSGSGEISFTNDTAPGAEVGMLRYNSTLGQMEHFNSSGWKDFTNQINIDYLVVAGGGAGGGNYRAGGGGGGGLRTSYGSTSGGGSSSEPTFNVILGTLYSVEVGDAGQAASNTQGGNGGSSSFATISCAGGGGGSPYGTADGSSGGSGGGSAGHDNLTAGAGGSGTYNQGNDGGGGVTSSPICGGGGGGGAATPGYSYWDQATSGDGGAGLEVNIIGGTGNFYAGGGGGGNYGATYGNVTAGGVGGGGAGGSCLCTASGVAGTANTGGGGGGSAWAGIGSHGGSGIVILRYPNAYTLNLPTSGTLTIGVLNATVSGGSTDKYTTFISGTGNISFT